MAADELTVDPLSLPELQQTIHFRLDESFSAIRTIVESRDPMARAGWTDLS